MNNLVSVARVSKLFGLSGEIVLNLYDRFPENMNMEEPLYVKIDTLAVPLFFEKFARRGRSSALVLFADIDSEVRAQEFVGQELFMRSASSSVGPDERNDDEIYFEDLVGYTAIVDNGIRGEIIEFIDSDFNPLFTIEINGKQVLVPAVDEFIVSLDEEKREIGFSLPEGLLDLFV